MFETDRLENIHYFKLIFIVNQDLSALDKLLGQLGIYATCLSSIAYLQKQLRIFYIFYATFFGSDYIRFLIQ